MTAAELVEFWRDARMMAMATVGPRASRTSRPSTREIDGTTLRLVVYDDTLRRRDLRANPRVSFTTWKDGAAAIVYGRARELPDSLRDARPGRRSSPAKVVTIEVALTRVYAMRAPERT